MYWLRCLCAPTEPEPAPQPKPHAYGSNTLHPQPDPWSPAKNEAPRHEPSASQSQEPASALVQSIDTAFVRLGNAGGEQPLYRRVNALLEACRLALGACDVRLAFFSTDGSTWVFLPSAAEEPEAAPRAAGWSQSSLYSLLAEQAGSVVVLRGYHSPTRETSSPDGSVPQPAAAAAQAGAPAGASARRGAPADCDMATNHVDTPPSSLRSAVQHVGRISAPESSSLVCRPLLQPLRLHPADMLALPVRQDGRLSAAMMVGWETAPAAPTAQGPLGGGIDICVEALAQLQRLAQFLVFGLTCDPQQARSLEQVAHRLSSLPTVNGLHDFVTCLLEAVPELLYVRFAVRMQPIFLLTHGLAAGGPAVLFSSRQQHHGQGPPGTTAAAVAVGEVLHQAEARAASSGSALNMWAGGAVNQFGSAASLRVDGHSDVGDGLSRIRAVRISLHHTLLAEALRSATKQASAAAQTMSVQPRSHSQLTAPSNGPAASAAVAAQLSLTSAVSSHWMTQGLPSGTDVPPLDPTVVADRTVDPTAAASSSQPAQPPPTFPSASTSQHSNPRIYTTIIPNIAAHLLEEGAPCRDLLLCSNLAGCGMGSIVLCVEAPPSLGNSSSGSAAALAALAAAALTSAGGGLSAPETQRAPSSQANVPNLSVLSQPLGMLHSQRQFGMYLVCTELLPAGVLQAVATEMQQLLGMALGACRDGALSVLSGGRCAWELYSLQEQLLGVNPSTPGGTSVSLSLANAIAAASFAAPPIMGSPGPPLSLAAGSGSVSRGGVTPTSSMLSRRVAQGRPMPRSLFAVAASGSHLSAGGIRSAGSPRLAHSQMQLSATTYATGHVLSQMRDSNNPSGSLTGAANGVSGDGGSLRWMLASSPEVLLEAPAAGPSPLEVMVSSMRSGLTAALSSAMIMDSSDEARAALSQELAAVRLFDVIGRGGQGVVFHGTLHGLETAVKVIVHRGKGEPLAHDGGDPGLATEGGAAGGGVAGGGAAPAVGADVVAAEDAGADAGEGTGGLSRIRKAKRGAMELVVTGTLSHPNIVQVLASFSDVIMVRCTYRNEPTPRLRLVAKDDPILASWAAPGPLNTVACLEYCDAGTLLDAAHSGAFRPPASSVLSGAVRPALVPLYMSLLEVALALRYLHSRRLVHCDLKPANVLLKSSTREPRGWTCKLSDFGCVRLMTELTATPEDLQRPFPQPPRQAGQQQPAPPTTVVGFRVAQPLGTIAYMAPESFIRSHTLGASIDIYAFGILMYELLMCRTPYVGIDAQTLPRLVLRQHLRPEFHPLAPPEYCHLAARCWSSHVTRRPTAVQLVGAIEALLVDAQLKDGRKLQRSGTRVSPLQPPLLQQQQQGRVLQPQQQPGVLPQQQPGVLPQQQQQLHRPLPPQQQLAQVSPAQQQPLSPLASLQQQRRQQQPVIQPVEATVVVIEPAVAVAAAAAAGNDPTQLLQLQIPEH